MTCEHMTVFCKLPELFKLYMHVSVLTHGSFVHYLSLDMRMPTAVARFRSSTASFCLALDVGFLADRCMA